MRDVALTPAARSLRRNARERGIVLRLRAAHVEGCTSPTSWTCYSPNESRQDEFAAEADESLRAQARIEAADSVSFDEYLASYFAA